jgi:hypothetical protein
MQNLLKSQVPPYCDIISYLLFEPSTSGSTGDDKKKEEQQFHSLVPWLPCYENSRVQGATVSTVLAVLLADVGRQSGPTRYSA